LYLSIYAFYNNALLPSNVLFLLLSTTVFVKWTAAAAETNFSSWQ
jgi:hypothetical protein